MSYSSFKKQSDLTKITARELLLGIYPNAWFADSYGELVHIGGLDATTDGKFVILEFGSTGEKKVPMEYPVYVEGK